MPRSPLRYLFLLAPVIACGNDSNAPTTPIEEVPLGPVIRTNPNLTQVGTVGALLNYDASRGGSAFTDPAGSPLTYTITLSGIAGVAATGAQLVGTPTVPGVHTIVISARDARGNVAADTFRLVVFAAGLPVPSLPATALAYSDARAPIPVHFTRPGPGGPVIATDNTPVANVTTDAGATLGRVLFYDPRLSSNDGVACASCHVQEVGFADTARFSLGIGGARTPRHSMPLGNARFYQRGRFFWDERAVTLEQQVLQPIQDPGEMGATLPSVVTKVAATPYYAPLFTAAFGSAEVTSDRIARALAQFVRSMVTGNAPYDAAFAAPGPPNFAAALSPQELEGFQLFTGPAGCARCHTTDAQVGINVMNNGLDQSITDAGAGGGRFKTPSLRNVGVRRHFMHDGRFSSLEQVVAHYDTGIRLSPDLDARLITPNGQPQRLNLTPGQRAALVAYLHSLTDPTFLSDPRFSSPFTR
jgi:cytochrome c peroxidase